MRHLTPVLRAGGGFQALLFAAKLLTERSQRPRVLGPGSACQAFSMAP